MAIQASYKSAAASNALVTDEPIMMVLYWKINVSMFWLLFYVTPLPDSLL